MAQQTITITVNGKRAETDFGEIVSFNENSYRLHFVFDSEWSGYLNRVAVVLWSGGCREKLFTGDECDLPAVTSPDCDTALVGVYSSDGAGKRIASSFVRLRCLAGAYCEPDEPPQKSLHEQILDLLGEYSFILGEKVTPGSYSSVDVNAFGIVTGGKQIVEVGGTGQSLPSASLADGGIFFRKEESGYTLCYYEDGELTAITGIGGGGAVSSVNGQTGAVTISKYDLGLADVALSGSYNDLEDLPAPAAVSSVNGQTGAVTISKYDLGLADVALSGSYNDLEDLPAPAAVTSVNGQTGAVTISKNDLGLADVAITGSYNDLEDLPAPAAVTSVNGQTGAVTISKNDLGLADVAISGSYNDLEDLPAPAAVSSVNGQTGAVTISKYDLGLADVAISGSYNDLLDKPDLTGGDSAVTSVNGQTGAVTISKYDLGLADVAITGSYNDLLDKPDFASGEPTVSSVNSRTGAVTISKYDLGLGLVENTRQFSLHDIARQGADFNALDETGCYFVQGSSGMPCSNAPASSANSASDCRWFLMTFSYADEGEYVTQLAISEKSDCAIRIRNRSDGVWGGWKTVI